MTLVCSGQMRHAIFHQRNAGTESTTWGDVTDNWQNIQRLWCSYTISPNGERGLREQVDTDATVKLTCRYNRNIHYSDRLLKSAAATLLNGAINDVVTTVTVDDSDFILSDKDTIIRVEDEFMIVTAGKGTTSLTVTRGAFGTSAAAHADDSGAYLYHILEIANIDDPDGVRQFTEITAKEIK